MPTPEDTIYRLPGNTDRFVSRVDEGDTKPTVTGGFVPQMLYRDGTVGPFSEAKLSADLMLEIPAGNIPGQSSVNKFGRNQTIQKAADEDIWDGGGSYAFYPTTAIAVDIVSTDGGDTQDYEVFGLDGTGALQSEIITATGDTAKDLANDYWRIFRVVNTNTTANAGTITIAADGGGGGVADNVVAAQITIGFNQTLMALYTIPIGKTGFMTQYGASMDGNANLITDSHIDVRVRPASSVSVRGIFQVKSHHGLLPAGSSHLQHSFMPYFKIEALSDIAMRGGVNASGDPAVDYHADFDLILVDD